ncbi:hypothetical protein K443DRAFT_70982, partial [Laccaria amethystina LaAM-08-1]
TRCMQKPRLTIFRVAVTADLAARRQIPADPSHSNTICDLPFLVPVFTTLSASPLHTVNAQTGRFIVEQATVSEGANFASSVLTCSNARFQ